MTSSRLLIKGLPPFLPKSVHTRLVHSGGNFAVFRCGDLLDRHSHGRLVIEVRQLVQPGTIHVQMCFDIGYQMGYACVARVTGATVMHIANGALDGVGLRIGGWQEEEG